MFTWVAQYPEAVAEIGGMGLDGGGLSVYCVIFIGQ